MNFHLLLIIHFVFAALNCQEIRINPYNLIRYDEKSYIIDLNNVTGKFNLSCYCSLCSSLRFKFSNDFHAFSNQVNFGFLVILFSLRLINCGLRLMISIIILRGKFILRKIYSL